MDKVFLGILIPFIGTALGSAFVFFIKNEISEKIRKLLLGWSGGIMVAAAIWSLLLPAIEQSELIGVAGWVSASVGICIGFLLLYLIQKTTKVIDEKNKLPTGAKQRSLVAFSITLHNIPEGMAVGVALAGAYFGGSLLTLEAALMLSIGIAIQNIPEGAIISMPMHLLGRGKTKSFIMGILSGIVEPIAAIITFFITGFASQILPFVLSFAAGSMLFVVIEELIPESEVGEGKSLATFGFMFGFILMLILDIVLG